MAIAENQTKPTNETVREYFARIKDEARRKDCEDLAELISKATNEPPKMWGAGIVGFGNYHYKDARGREGDACLIGFSSRKGYITVYGLHGAAEAGQLLGSLGKHKAGGGWVYIETLADVDLKVLTKLVANAVAEKKRRHL